MKIQLTNDWAVEVVVCANLETLGIDADDPEVLQDAMQAAGAIFDRYFNHCWSLVKEDSFFANWHGGKYRHKDYCEGYFAFDFFTRDVAEDIEMWEENGEQAYGDWYWVESDSVPLIMKFAITAILEKCTEAIDSVIEAYQAN